MNRALLLLICGILILSYCLPARCEPLNLPKQLSKEELRELERELEKKSRILGRIQPGAAKKTVIELLGNPEVYRKVKSPLKTKEIFGYSVPGHDGVVICIIDNYVTEITEGIRIPLKDYIYFN